MRLTAPSSRSSSSKSLPDQKREQARRRRVSADALSEAFPSISQLRIELGFRDTSDTPPSGQVHDLFPPAPAHFEFACPYGDCDGVLDLREAVSSMIAAAKRRAEGGIGCSGTRAGPAGARRPCGLNVSYRVTARQKG
jgi:hypothetical protein